MVKIILVFWTFKVFLGRRIMDILQWGTLNIYLECMIELVTGESTSKTLKGKYVLEIGVSEIL